MAKKNLKKELAEQSRKKKRKSSLMLALDELLGVQSSDGPPVQKSGGPQKSGLTAEEREALKHYEEGIQKTLDLIAPAGIEIKRNEVILNDLHAKSFFVYNWPNYIFPNWLSPTVNYDAEMDISQFIYPVSNKAIMKMLRKKVAELRSSIRMLEQRGVVRDPTLEAALQDAEELRDLLARGQEKLFQFGMYLTIYSDDEEKLKKMESDIESLLGGKLVMTKPAVFQMEHAWTSTLPFCLDELEITRNMNTSPLATSFPFTSSDLTDDHGILYGINRHNDSLVIFDRFDLANANATVFATSGAGKSFTVKLEILRSMMFGTEVFIIDPENEYVELSKVVGGTFIPMSLQSSFCINPFDLPLPVRGKDAKKGETLRAAVITLHGLFKLMLGTLTPSEDGILDKAILDTFALKDITLDTENPHELEPPTMHELVDVLMTTDGGENMAQTLMKYTEGSYAGIFNKQTNVELDNQLVVFQIRDLEEPLRPIAMYVVLNFLWNRIRANLKRRFLVIDEAWNLMQHEDSAKFLYGLIKRARKYYLGVTTITQDVEDFVNSPYGKPIVTNAQLQILLKQSPTAVDNLQKLFYLTDGEKYLLLNSDVGQGLFFAGNKHVAIQVVASPEETKVITTKPQDVADKQEADEDAAEEAAQIAAAEAAAKAATETGKSNTTDETKSEESPTKDTDAETEPAEDKEPAKTTAEAEEPAESEPAPAEKEAPANTPEEATEQVATTEEPTQAATEPAAKETAEEEASDPEDPLDELDPLENNSDEDETPPPLPLEEEKSELERQMEAPAATTPKRELAGAAKLEATQPKAEVQTEDKEPATEPKESTKEAAEDKPATPDTTEKTEQSEKPSLKLDGIPDTVMKMYGVNKERVPDKDKKSEDEKPEEPTTEPAPEDPETPEK